MDPRSAARKILLLRLSNPRGNGALMDIELPRQLEHGVSSVV